MVKHPFFLLVAAVLFIPGCINPPPQTPPLTEAQMRSALLETEQQLSQEIQQQCTGWSQQQQEDSEQFQLLQQGQQQIGSRLESLESSLNKHQQQLVAVSEAKPVECPPPSPAAKSLDNKLLVGEVEWLWIEAVNKVYEARVDTGATTSSISATQITPFEKDGKRWVRFQLAPDDSETQYAIEAPLVRYVRIKQASSEELDRRPVAKLTVRLGKLTEVAEFTLTDRSDMNYPILLGREFLKDIAVVDVSKKNVQPKPEIVSGQPEVKAVTKPAQ